MLASCGRRRGGGCPGGSHDGRGYRGHRGQQNGRAAQRHPLCSGKRACTAALRAHTADCYAEIRKLVKKGTKGAHRSRTPTARPAGTIGPAGGLTPVDLATAYGLNTTGGSGQTVAIVDAYNDPNINADLQTFDSQYGLAACSIANGCLKVVNQTGGATPPANDTTGWSVEESLDVEAVHSVCQVCNIILVEANSTFDRIWLPPRTRRSHWAPRRSTNSFGGPEGGCTTSYESAFNHPGVVITASAGDDGYYDYDLLSAVEPAGRSPASTPRSASAAPPCTSTRRAPGSGVGMERQRPAGRT